MNTPQTSRLARLFLLGTLLLLPEMPAAAEEALIEVMAPPLALPARAAAFELTETREPCADFASLRRPFFGDLHVHTTLSLDAATQGTRNRPADAYRFARGEELGIQPYENDRARRRLRLARPLDFTAVTDHAELFGELHICRTAGADGYDAILCRIYRRWPRLAFFLINGVMADNHDFSFCGANNELCREAARGPWAETRAAAEEAYDRSEKCDFTSFVAYEWTGAPDTNNLHRNVIFRNADALTTPASARTTGSVSGLWRALAKDCEGREGRCQALVIPHNSNLSGGLMFAPTEEDGTPFTAEYARRRAEIEPLAELSQHKGDSECRLGIGTSDELCGFELLPYGNFGGKFASLQNVEPNEGSFVRNALREGLALGRALGTNPFQLGVISSTDTHLGTPGAVAEADYPGHGGAGAPSSVTMPVGLPDDIEFNPGGLAVLWAEENSRDALFAAMQRRETYSTTGPRISVRFFGGWNLPDDLCNAPDFVARGYAGGVPMGGHLGAAHGKSAPRFAVSALRDAGGLATPLERIQIIKGWLDEDGVTHEKVYEVAGETIGQASVDPRTCEPYGPGANQLCTVFVDPDFDPDQPAFWYARVVENPVCRWQSYLCLTAGVDCTDPATIGKGFEGCCDADYPRQIQERAVTSAIHFAGSAQ
jgi:hypothetical protein